MTMTTTFLLIAGPVDEGKCPTSTILFVNKQQKMEKSYIFVRKWQTKLEISQS